MMMVTMTFIWMAIMITTDNKDSDYADGVDDAMDEFGW